MSRIELERKWGLGKTDSFGTFMWALDNMFNLGEYCISWNKADEYWSKYWSPDTQ